jgi:hypothetical protein
MSEINEFKRARFVPQTGTNREPIPVHFNPVTLQYAVTNTMRPGQGNSTKQYVSQSTGKLTMDLIFDTTDSGQDVRTFTEKIANFMKPGADHVPPVMLFEWGTYKFQGMAEAYRETIDFFAPSGVPLRASVNLTLSSQDEVFTSTGQSASDPLGGPLNEPFDVPGSSVDSVTSLAAQAGDPRAARGIAEANGLASLRVNGGASLSISASVSLSGPAAFSSGAGLSAGAGAGFGVGGSLAAAGASFGSSASAGVSASAGAFSGLRSSGQPATSVRLNLNALAPGNQVANLATDSGASFQLGGKAILESSSSLTASVGAQASSKPRLQFED